MDGYTILYDGNGVTFGGAWLDDYSAVVFKVQIWEKSTSGLDVGYSAAGYFSLLDTSKYCKQLQRMYETLSGECVIEDCDWDDGNKLKFYFDGRQLKIDGKITDTTQTLTFSCYVDQTILLPLITLLKAYN